MSRKSTSDNLGFTERLRKLQESFDLALTNPITPAKCNLTNYLVFRLGRESFAWPISCLHEVLVARKIIPVPGNPKNLHGVINYRNKVLTVTNLHFRLRLEPTAPGSKNTLLITKKLPTKTALLVDQLIGFQEVAEENIKAKPFSLDPETSQMIVGEFLYEGKMITLLNPNTTFG